jgi:hypothetical protein
MAESKEARFSLREVVMISFSILHWFIIVSVLSLALWSLIPSVVAKAGFSPWWAVLAIVPLVNIIMLWVFAYAKWPALPERS